MRDVLNSGARQEEKYRYLDKERNIQKCQVEDELQPDKRYTWLTEGLHAEFDRTLSPMGSKEAKRQRARRTEVDLRKLQQRCQATNRDAWAYNFNRNALTEETWGG